MIYGDSVGQTTNNFGPSRGATNNASESQRKANLNIS